MQPIDRTTLYLNILLGVAALFIVAAAILFITVADSTFVKAISLWVVAAVFYGTGLGLHAGVAKLRPVGFALTAIGLAIIPIAGVGLGGWQLTSGTWAWFISSAVGVLAYLGAAFVLRSEIVTWLSVAFAFSLTMSMMALTPAPVVWYFVILILTTAPLMLLAHLLRGRLAEKFIRPQLILGDVLAPLAVVGALAVRPLPSRLEWGILFAALGVHFLVGALLRRSALRGAAARFCLAVAVLFILNGLVAHGHLGLDPIWALTVTSGAGFLLAAAFFGEAGLRGHVTVPRTVSDLTGRPADGLTGRTASDLTGRATNSFTGRTLRVRGLQVALLLGGAAFTAIGLLFSAVPSDGGGRTVAAAVLAVCGLISAAAGVWAALRADALAPLGAATATLMQIGMIITTAGFVTGDRNTALGDMLPVGSVATAVFVWSALLLVCLAAVGARVSSASGRRLRTLRAAMPLFLPAAALLMLGHAPVAAVRIESPLSGIVVVAVLAALGLCAWWARNALLLLGALPVGLAFGFFLADIAAAAGLSEHDSDPTIVLPGCGLILALAIGSLSVVQERLRRGGRTWRARYALIASGILAGVFVSGLIGLSPFALLLRVRGPVLIFSDLIIFTTLIALILSHGLTRRGAAGRSSASSTGSGHSTAGNVAAGNVTHDNVAPGNVAAEPKPTLQRSPAAAPTPRRLAALDLRLIPLSTTAVVAFFVGVLLISRVPTSEVAASLTAATLLGLLACMAVGYAFVARIPEVQLLGFLAAFCAFSTAGSLLFTDAALTGLLAAWLVWLIAYGLYWVIAAGPEKRMANAARIVGFTRWSISPLIGAFIAMLVAFANALFVDAEVPALHSLTMVIAGITLMMPALMLVLLAQRIPNPLARYITAEAATYVGAIGAMIAVGGVWNLRFVVLSHLLLAAAIGWAVFHSRRVRPGASTGSVFLRVDLRTVPVMTVVTVSGIIAAFTSGEAAYSVLFLIDHAVLLVAGGVLLRAWALWWGLAGVCAGMVWFLRDLMYVALVIMALVIIGVVVWQLLRRSPASSAPAAGAPPTSGSPTSAPPATGHHPPVAAQFGQPPAGPPPRPEQPAHPQPPVRPQPSQSGQTPHRQTQPGQAPHRQQHPGQFAQPQSHSERFQPPQPGPAPAPPPAPGFMPPAPPPRERSDDWAAQAGWQPHTNPAPTNPPPAGPAPTDRPHGSRPPAPQPPSGRQPGPPPPPPER